MQSGNQMLRYLRIAVTGLCLTACVLLIVLWVRGYWRWDNLDMGADHRITSLSGKLIIDEQFVFSSLPDWMASPRSGPLFGSSFELSTFNVGGVTPRGTGTAIPNWFLILVSATIAAAPWIRWRFSLRTLLIVTTLVAVGLVAVFG
jgi:hypothetical protein